MSGTIILASSGPNGIGNAPSSNTSLSADGTKVAFDSAASNLVAGDTNTTRDVFVKNLATGTVTLASAGSGGQGNGFSSNPSLSADGAKIAFNSTASNLVAGDTNGLRDVFIKNLATGAVTLVSPGPDWPDYSRSSSPVLSADGTKIMFESFASNSPTSGMFDFPIFGDIFVKDLATGAVTRLTDARGSGGSSGDSFSADGTKVSFTTVGRNFTTDVFVQDLATGVVTLANGAPDGRGNAPLGSSSLSADGTKVAFSSASILVDGDTNGSNDIFVKDLATNAITLASSGPNGVGNASSFATSLTADGTKVAFQSNASNLVPGDTNGRDDVFVKDLVTGAVTLASAGPAGQGNGSSSSPSLSADGAKVAFDSAASNLTTGDTNGSTDAFVKGLSVPINMTTIGAGPDSLVLRVSQNAYQGSAQYTVSLDGNQVGGILTASASRGSGSDVITVRADLAPGPHEVRLTFLNDAYGGTPATDRNLFLDGATYNGATVPGAQAALYSAGPAIFGITDNTPPPSGNAVTVGAGPDALVLKLQQDAYRGDAQYTVSVDGAQVGGVLTASATRASGQSDTLTVRGTFAPGGHTASVAFLNDAWGGTPDTDRNLYVTGGTYNGAAVPGAGFALYSSGSTAFGFTDVMG